ncbi:hypothetical protein AMC90_CH02879 [Rhizobium phaseoli]|uniref:hypothetical protein n=1 Tax=Rhizobium phaseoli TaxID=396 RepID=UPI0007EB4BCC|nr:hypothetical protein [Rhizobium phaseoli]ANL28678.1 hypothetical protein AMC90_CH02879 [Rhizobium phaseoli]ANM05006.1 hypothetical protein AMC78_CH02929 [Rhizobium phaseoli]
MKSTLTDEEWQLIYDYYGDVAHQYSELHQAMLLIAKSQNISARAKAILERAPDVPPDPGDKLI